MNDNNKIRLFLTDFFFYLIALSIGFLIIMSSIIIVYFDVDRVTFGVSIWILCFSGLAFICVVIRYIQYLLYYIKIDCETITLYCGKKIVKQINIADIKSLVLGQYVGSMLGETNPDKFTNSNKFIILNDGTFFNKKWTRRSFRKKKLSADESWIAIEFSAKRYAALKKLLPNCEIETCTIYDK